ncbi:hypothetical protein HPB48_013268 [Haemaphysalis longicornis]|uniref:Uncharacterized protein n=1 Tax=Haemaphysalis longicornis TaxID=44386 RepID=A0A9J6GC03_HAELO|nr:hypothetical protein HPB48_013268 [Haemaphysalis longicornis]
MSDAPDRISFPIVGWEFNLSAIPTVTEKCAKKFYARRTGTARSSKRSYNFYVEQYVQTASLWMNSKQLSNGLVYVKAACFRSKKKNAGPYVAMFAFDKENIVDGIGDCPAGKVACNQLMATIRTVIHLQSNGFSEPPDQLSCTDLPQQWRVPRDNQIKGRSIQSLNWRGVRDGGSALPKLAHPKESRAFQRSIQEQQQAKQKLAKGLLALEPKNAFAKALPSTQSQQHRETLYGPASILAPLSYQQYLLPHGFDVHLSGVSLCIQSPAQSLPTLPLFTSSLPWVPQPHLARDDIPQTIQVSNEAAQDLERGTRKQSTSTTWQNERHLRLTSSKFGTVLTRKVWSTKGRQNLKTPRDLSRVPSIE